MADNGVDWVVADLAAESRRGARAASRVLHRGTARARGRGERHGQRARRASCGLRSGGRDRRTTLVAPTLPRRPSCRAARRSSPSPRAPPGRRKALRCDQLSSGPVARSIAGVARARSFGAIFACCPSPCCSRTSPGCTPRVAAEMQFCVPPLAEVGMRGRDRASTPTPASPRSSSARPQSVILLPQMLAALTSAVEPAPSRRAACVRRRGRRALRRRSSSARAALGLPAYEGYGLSECASVVALNHSGRRSSGQRRAAARPCSRAHRGTRDRGERQPHVAPPATSAGLDADGFLYVEGRRRNVLITSFGRNVSPEWPEAELLAGGAIAQAAVFGEARAAAVRGARRRRPMRPSEAIEAQVRAANQRLPDYAQRRRVGARR